MEDRWIDDGWVNLSVQLWWEQQPVQRRIYDWEMTDGQIDGWKKESLVSSLLFSPRHC